MVGIKQFTLSAALLLSAAENTLAAPAVYSDLAVRGEIGGTGTELDTRQFQGIFSALKNIGKGPGSKGGKNNNKKDKTGAVVGRTKKGIRIIGGVLGRDMEQREEAGYVDFVERDESEDLAEREFGNEDLLERSFELEDIVERDFDVEDLVEREFDLKDLIKRYVELEDLVKRDFEADDLVERDFELEDLFERDFDVEEIDERDFEAEDLAERDFDFEDLYE